MRRYHRSTALGLLACLSIAQGCSTYRVPRQQPGPGVRVQVESKTPFEIYSGGEITPTADRCLATMIRGTIESVRGDTLTLHPVKKAWQGGQRAPCPVFARATLSTHGDPTRVRVQGRSTARTVGLVVGITVIAIAVAAIAAMAEFAKTPGAAPRAQ